MNQNLVAIVCFLLIPMLNGQAPALQFHESVLPGTYGSFFVRKKLYSFAKIAHFAQNFAWRTAIIAISLISPMISLNA